MPPETDEITVLKKRIEQLEEALEPFARVYLQYGLLTDEAVKYIIHLGDWERAAEAMHLKP